MIPITKSLQVRALTVLTFHGDLGSLTKDVMIAAEDFNWSGTPTLKYIVILPTEMIVLLFLLGVASALAGAGIAFLITRTSRKK